MRFLLLLYPAAMSFMLVYYGEHYVVDILAGFALAAAIMWACTDWELGGASRRISVRVNQAILGRESSGFDAEAQGMLPRLRRLPPLVVPCVLLGLAAVAALGSWYAAIPAALTLLGFVGWLVRTRRASAKIRHPRG
jgi:hypothetical protein